MIAKSKTLRVAAAAFPALAAGLSGVASAETFAWRADYQGDAFTVVDGGLTNGGSYVDLFAVGADGDLDAAFGWDGAVASVSIQRSNGGAPSGRIGEAQAISSLEAGDDATRLFEAWIEAPLGGVSIKAGLIDLNSEFDSSEPRSLFLQSSQGIGPEFAGSGEAGPSIFPVSGLGVRARAQAGDWSFAFGAFDGRPGDPDDPEAFTDFEIGGQDGALITTEAKYTADERLHLAVGLWGYTTELERLPRDAADPGGRDQGSYGGYVGMDAPLPAPQGEVRGFVRIGASAARFNAVDTYLGAGMVWSGPFAARPNDTLGFSVASAGFSDGAQFLVAEDGGKPADREHTFELTYNLLLADWFSLQPALVYVVSPGGREDIGDALALGARFAVSIGGSSFTH
jgi:porin